MSDTPTLVRFINGWQRDGNGKDGLPLYRPTLLIRLDRPPYLSVEREASEEDIADHPGPFELYRKTQEARAEVEGYPLAMWPVCLPHLFQMCAARGLFTVEQLAQLVLKKRRAETVRTIPPDIVELADRAAKLVELQSKSGKYEEIISDLQSQAQVLREQMDEAISTIAAQKTLIDQLRLKAAA